MGLQFEWDEEKEKINIVKHGIDFKTASHVFLDQNRLEFLMRSIVLLRRTVYNDWNCRRDTDCCIYGTGGSIANHIRESSN